jgi:hypothetical protein
MRDDRLRLVDMAESIRKIEKYTSSGKQEFIREELVQVWVVHYLQVLGEAARSASEESGENITGSLGAGSLDSGIFSSITILRSIPTRSGQLSR